MEPTTNHYMMSFHGMELGTMLNVPSNVTIVMY